VAAYCLAGAHLLRNKGDVEGAVAAARGWLEALLQGGEQGAGTVLEWLEVGGGGGQCAGFNQLTHMQQQQLLPPPLQCTFCVRFHTQHAALQAAFAG
jgi:hypothetical protein